MTPGRVLSTIMCLVPVPTIFYIIFKKSFYYNCHVNEKDVWNMQLETLLVQLIWCAHNHNFTDQFFCKHLLLQDVRLKPLGGYALENARQEGEKLRQMRRVIRESISHIFLLWTVMTIAYVAHTDWTYFAAANKVDVFVASTGHESMNFTEIQT